MVTSEHPGVGKSLVVQRLAEQVKNLLNNVLIAEVMESQSEEPPPMCVTIPFHDKHTRVGDVVGFFLPHAISSEVPLSRIFHLDRSSTVRFSFRPPLNHRHSQKKKTDIEQIVTHRQRIDGQSKQLKQPN